MNQHTAFIPSSPLPRPHLHIPPTRRPRRQLPICAQPPPPKPVKPAFYKNPSKAIEKGGGFYIPGLRGPRLRYFVAAISTALLFTNHLTSPVVDTSSLATSEALAALATVAIFTTAIIDSRSATTSSVSHTTSDALVVTSNVVPVATANNTSSPVNPDIAWATAVATDLTSAIAISHFDSSLTQTFATPGAEGPAGAVVKRVAREGRALYVADIRDLPPDVTLPFLKQQSAVFVTPVGDGVVVFAATLQKGFSVEQRRWLAVLAERFECL